MYIVMGKFQTILTEAQQSGALLAEFKKYDISDSGYVTAKEFRNVLQSLGALNEFDKVSKLKHSAEQAMVTVLRRWGVGRREKLEYKKFVDFIEETYEIY